MDLNFTTSGNLEPGIFEMSFKEFEETFGYNDHRKALIEGLKKGIKALRDCGCGTLYIDGSFVTKKDFPGDFDACWDSTRTDIYKMQKKYPLLLEWTNNRKAQKEYYRGEFFIAENIASNDPYALFLDFFQTDREGNPKGIVQLKI